MSETVGYVCFKGPHAAWAGESDYGVCGSKAFASIVIDVVENYPNPRNESYTAEDAAAQLREIVDRDERMRERERWSGSVAEFIAWADASPAVTWSGRLGLKERWEHRDDPEYQEMLRKLGEAS